LHGKIAASVFIEAMVIKDATPPTKLKVCCLRFFNDISFATISGSKHYLSLLPDFDED